MSFNGHGLYSEDEVRREVTNLLEVAKAALE